MPRALLRMASKNRTDERVEQETGSELDDLTLVFDGLFSQRRWEELVQYHSGTVAGDVSSNADYLVIGDDSEQTTRDAAYEYDVPAITEHEFKDLLRAKGVDSQMTDFS